jgi:hypothetical protein
MRTIQEILKGFLSKPLSYWLGWDGPCKYEVENGRIFIVTASSRREMLVLSEIICWKKEGEALSVRQPDCTRIIGDPSNELGAILEREAPERWMVDTEKGDSI